MTGSVLCLLVQNSQTFETLFLHSHTLYLSPSQAKQISKEFSEVMRSQRRHDGIWRWKDNITLFNHYRACWALVNQVYIVTVCWAEDTPFEASSLLHKTRNILINACGRVEVTENLLQKKYGELVLTLEELLYGEDQQYVEQHILPQKLEDNTANSVAARDPEAEKYFDPKKWENGKKAIQAHEARTEMLNRFSVDLGENKIEVHDELNRFFGGRFSPGVQESVVPHNLEPLGTSPTDSWGTGKHLRRFRMRKGTREHLSFEKLEQNFRDMFVAHADAFNNTNNNNNNNNTNTRNTNPSNGNAVHDNPSGASGPIFNFEPENKSSKNRRRPSFRNTRESALDSFQPISVDSHHSHHNQSSSSPVSTPPPPPPPVQAQIPLALQIEELVQVELMDQQIRSRRVKGRIGFRALGQSGGMMEKTFAKDMWKFGVDITASSTSSSDAGNGWQHELNRSVARPFHSSNPSTHAQDMNHQLSLSCQVPSGRLDATPGKRSPLVFMQYTSEHISIPLKVRASWKNVSNGINTLLNYKINPKVDVDSLSFLFNPISNSSSSHVKVDHARSLPNGEWNHDKQQHVVHIGNDQSNAKLHKGGEGNVKIKFTTDAADTSACQHGPVLIKGTAQDGSVCGVKAKPWIMRQNQGTDQDYHVDLLGGVEYNVMIKMKVLTSSSSSSSSSANSSSPASMSSS